MSTEKLHVYIVHSGNETTPSWHKIIGVYSTKKIAEQHKENLTVSKDEKGNCLDKDGNSLSATRHTVRGNESSISARFIRAYKDANVGDYVTVRKTSTGVK